MGMWAVGCAVPRSGIKLHSCKHKMLRLASGTMLRRGFGNRGLATAIAVHGGAWNIPSELREESRSGCEAAAAVGNVSALTSRWPTGAT